jgi:G3E family GTPase
LRTIAAMPRCDGVLVEATGIAQTGDLMAHFEAPEFGDAFEIRANLCLVDALNFIKVLPFLKAAAGQVEHADGIVINKTDLVPRAELSRLKAILAELNPEAKQTRVRFGAVDATFLASLAHVRRPSKAIHGPPRSIASASFEGGKRVERDRFLKLVQKLGRRLLRLKGNVEFDDGLRYVELVGDAILEKPACPQLGDRTSFSVIAWKLTREQLEKRFGDLLK